jgi:hypothetical protein
MQAKPGTTSRVQGTLRAAETTCVPDGKGVPVAGIWCGKLVTRPLHFCPLLLPGGFYGLREHGAMWNCQNAVADVSQLKLPANRSGLTPAAIAVKQPPMKQ